MKATVLYCDRCYREGKDKVQAALVVWIRTSLGGRTMRQDVCSAHLATIVGQSTDGAAPTVPAISAPATGRLWSRRGGPGLYQNTYDRLLPYIAKHERFSFDDVAAYLGKDTPTPRAQRVLSVLLAQRKVERYRLGIYQRPGYTMPEPATVELASAAALKLIKAHPGIRGSVVAALAGVESIALWKATLAALREEKLVRTKGTKSGMRMYPA
jgi:hypothetical protein